MADATDRAVVEAALRVQGALGVGLSERTYLLCLAHALAKTGRRVHTGALLAVDFEGLRIPEACRIDLLVDDVVVVEVKAVEGLQALHLARLHTCLRLSGKEIGLLLNFWTTPLKDGGIQRLRRVP